MGSSNIQCRLSGETIDEGDDVVFVVLDTSDGQGKLSNLKKHVLHTTSHWVPASLPIRGKYADYQTVAPSDDAVSKWSYDLFTHLFVIQRSDWSGGFSADRLTRKYGNKTDDNLALWVARADAFDLLMLHRHDLFSSSIDDIISSSYESSSWKHAASKMIPELASAIESTGDNIAKSDTTDGLAFQVAELTVLEKSLGDMGMYFYQAPNMARQGAYKDYAIRVKFHHDVHKISAKSSTNSQDVLFRCPLSGVGIGDKDRFYVLEVINDMEIYDWQKWRNVAGHSATDQYIPLGAPTLCEWDRGHLKIVDGPIGSRAELRLNDLLDCPDLTESVSVSEQLCVLSVPAMEALQPIIEKARDKFDSEAQILKQRFDALMSELKKMPSPEDQNEEQRMYAHSLVASYEDGVDYVDVASDWPGDEFNIASRMIKPSFDGSLPRHALRKLRRLLAHATRGNDENGDVVGEYRMVLDQVLGVARDTYAMGAAFDHANVAVMPSLKSSGDMSFQSYKSWNNELRSMCNESMRHKLAQVDPDLYDDAELSL